MVAASGGACEAARSQPSAIIEQDASRRFAADRDDGSGQELLPDAGVKHASAANSGETKPLAKPAEQKPKAEAKPKDVCSKFVMPEDCKNAEGRPLPNELRCTGLYADWENRQLACGVSAYTPAYESSGSAEPRYTTPPTIAR